MTITIITIINTIIIIIYYKYEGRYLSTFHACETHLGLSRWSQRMLLLPTMTSSWTSFGRFFWGGPLSWSQSSQWSLSSCSTGIREGAWALFRHVNPTSGSPEGHNGCSSPQRGPVFGTSFGELFWRWPNSSRLHVAPDLTSGLVLAFQGLPEPDFQSPNLSLVLWFNRTCSLFQGKGAGEAVHFSPVLAVKSLIIIMTIIIAVITTKVIIMIIMIIFTNIPIMIMFIRNLQREKGAEKAAKNGSEAWFEKTIPWVSGALISAVFQVRCLKFWT